MNFIDGQVRWPALCGEPQYDWEPLRVVIEKGIPNRTKRLKALGNCVVPQQILPILLLMAGTMRQEWRTHELAS